MELSKAMQELNRKQLAEERYQEALHAEGDGIGRLHLQDAIRDADARPDAKTKSERRAFAANQQWTKGLLRDAAARLQRNEVMTSGERKSFVAEFKSEITTAPAAFQVSALAALDQVISDVAAGGNGVSVVHVTGSELSELLGSDFVPPDDADVDESPRALADRIAR